MSLLAMTAGKMRWVLQWDGASLPSPPSRRRTGHLSLIMLNPSITPFAASRWWVMDVVRSLQSWVDVGRGCGRDPPLVLQQFFYCHWWRQRSARKVGRVSRKKNYCRNLSSLGPNIFKNKQIHDFSPGIFGETCSVLFLFRAREKKVCARDLSGPSVFHAQDDWTAGRRAFGSLAWTRRWPHRNEHKKNLRENTVCTNAYAGHKKDPEKCQEHFFLEKFKRCGGGERETAFKKWKLDSIRSLLRRSRVREEKGPILQGKGETGKGERPIFSPRSHHQEKKELLGTDPSIYRKRGWRGGKGLSTLALYPTSLQRRRRTEGGFH